MSSLSMRLKALQVSGETPKFNFDHVSMKRPEKSVIDFGQARTSGPDVSGGLGTSRLGGKVRRQVREMGPGKSSTISPFCAAQDRTCRTRARTSPLNVGPKTSTMKPKMKPKAAPRQIYQVPVESVPDMNEEDFFELLPMEEEMPIGAPEMQNDGVEHLETRMLHMEDALGGILAHLENPIRGSEAQ